MTSGYADLLAWFAFLFVVSIMSLAYVGRKIIVKQGRPSDIGTEEQKEVTERKPVEEEAGPSEKQEEVAERTPVEELAGPSEKQEGVAERNPVEEEAGASTAFDFDVFISFMGKDTWKGFTSHLYKELYTRGITAFIGSEDSIKEGKINDLFMYIEKSKIFVPVFSQNCADSHWCLREITKMEDIYKREGKRRPIIPIFYHVDPSDVRHWRGSFGEAFKKHQQDKELGEEEINEWKAALTEAGKISGFAVSHAERTTEAEIIARIGKEVSDILSKVPFDIQPVGINSYIDTLKQMLEKEKDAVQMIGICGLGGIGKTTLAMALFNEIFRTFEGCCFLLDMRENVKKRDLTSLQKKLMKSVLGDAMSIVNVRQGVNLMKQMLGRKKVLLVLDDVVDTCQLEALTGDRGEKEECFGAGSNIIITTRDKEVLLQHGLQEDDIYFFEGLNKEDSLQLFCHDAFDKDQPLAGFHELSGKVVEVARGLPLALKVFGSLFYGLEEKQEWEEMLKKIKMDQQKEIHERLKISYDDLVDREKCVFLDIACFFIGKKKEYPVYMWEACGCSPTVTLKALEHRSLIRVNENDEFEMHDQIRDMGRMIVKEEGNFDPLKYSRLWSNSQVMEVLVDAEVSMWNPDVEGIDFQKVWSEAIGMSWKVIEEMQSLRMIIGANDGRCFVDQEKIIRFPSNLRWFNWNNCPYETLAFYNDQHEKICVLELNSGHFLDFRSHSMVFPELKVLDLSRCLHLTHTPDFTHFPFLEKLVLDECCSLTKMDESIGHLKQLVKLSMVGCKQISVLPTQIGDLRSLKYLELCGTSISTVPNSIRSLQSLEKLDLTGCFLLEKVPDSICGLMKLSHLSLQHCELLKQLPNSMGMLPSLRELKIDYCKSLREVPDSLGDLNKDLQISLEGCTLLEKFPKSIRMSANVEEKAGPSMATPEKGCFDFVVDVFISFRGKDTWKGFTSHLHQELITHGITAFIDSEDLEKGGKISVPFESIEGSKIFVPVFSQNYADSKRCLKEIAKMVEIYKREGKQRRPIIPIFYDVDPSDVKHYRKSFEGAFKKHQKNKELGEEEINEWKAALTEAGKISGYDLSKDKRNEAEIITCIRKSVSDILCKVRFDIQPVGIVPGIHTLKQMLDRENDDICMIGICGLGGIGKTTLAMALYNELSPTFEGSCFLSDIRSKGKTRDGLPTLQAKLMNEVLGRETKKIATVEQGVSLIKQLLRDRKVLLILDDVDDKEQLEAFTADCRKREKWFGKGSKIIVTTRDKRVLLQQGLQEHHIYFPEGLNREDSLQLFCRDAFVRDQPLVGFEELSWEVVKVAKGLPLALKVFGLLFCNLKEKEEWEKMLETLKTDQHEKIHERLKISYDSLHKNEQSVFLDIACFFIGQNKEYPVYMWEACGYFPSFTLRVLQYKSLIKINEDGMFEMHDQIRDMGKMIVKEEANSDPLKYSRLWREDQVSEVLKVLNDAKVSLENPYVQGIHFNEDFNGEIEMNWRVIEAMPSLRMITGADERLHCFEDEEETIRLPRNVRWLEWRYCPYQILTFHNNRHEQLCVLDLSDGDFRDFGSHRMVFPKLKVLNLGRCRCLIQTPDFTDLPSLEVLTLDECELLTQMDESIGQLKKLVKLSLRRCSKLKELPAGLCKLSSLEFLDLHECEGISVLPIQIGDLTSLKDFDLERTSISDVPDSIGSLLSLERLCLNGCKGISILPEKIGDLTSLKDLTLAGTSISALPDSIGCLQSLEKLDLSECTSLQKIHDSIGDLKSLSRLSLGNCMLLEQLPSSMGMLTSLKELNIDHCKLLREVPDSLGNLNNDIQISLEGCMSLEKLPNSLWTGFYSL